MKKVLVVEDEAVARLALTECLTSVGYSVESAASGEEALKILQSHTFNAAIVDFKLNGEVNGFEVLSEFERITPGRGKILVTAYLAEQVRAEAVGALFVPKPVNLDDLLRKLEAVL